MSLEKIPATELRDTLDLAPGVLRKWVQRDKIEPDYYDYQSTPGPGRSRLVIDPRGLPDEYRRQWVMQQIEGGDLPTPSAKETSAYEWKSAAAWRREEARKRFAFYKAVPGELSTEAKKEAVQRYKEETPEDDQPGGVSMASWYRYRKAYEKDGLAGLMPDPRPGRESKVRDDDYERFKTLYLTRDRRSARQCWQRVVGAAKAEGRDVSDFPVAQTFVNHVKSREGEDFVTICREGVDEYQQKHSPYISRDWGAVAAGDVWFSDHRLFDVFVLDPETGEVGRPWITPWMDARSTFILGADVYLEHPNSDRIHLTFKRAVQRHGLPEVVYIDNGKDYRALDFAGGPNRNQRGKIKPDVDEERSRNVLDLLDVEAVFAKPYNARAKTIERKFQFLIEHLEKFSRGYAGTDAERRPDVTERRRRASVRHPEAADEMDFLCTLSDFRDRVHDWIDRINRIPSDGRVLDGHSPKEVFYAERGTERRIDPKHLGILCLRTSSERQIRRCEWKDATLGITYTAEWMHDPRVSRTTAYARRDPQDPEQAWIFDAEDGSLLGVAERKPEIDAMAQLGSDDDREALEEQMEQHQRYVQHLKQKKRDIEQNQPSEDEMDSWFDAYLDAREEDRKAGGDYLDAGPRQVQHEESETAREWIDKANRQARTGTDDLPYAVEETSNESNLKLWPDE